MAALPDGLGLLPGSCCPHYDGEEQRRPLYTRLVADGELAPGYAADDAAALVFEGTELREVVCTEEGSRGYRLERDARLRSPRGCSRASPSSRRAGR